MKKPLIVPLSKLRVGDCFQFAYQAVSGVRPEASPEWEIVQSGQDFCAIVLKSSASSASLVKPASAARLPKTTLVHPLPRPNAGPEGTGIGRSVSSSLIENVRTYPGDPTGPEDANTPAPLAH